jgi:hypothetical protein
MNILAVVPYAGSKKLVKMTEAMVRSLTECAGPMIDEGKFRIVAINNNADGQIPTALVDWHGYNDTNEGFGNAINLAIKRELRPSDTHVLVLNNDLTFPHTSWLQELIAEAETDVVCAPCTDVTATREAIAEGPRDLDPLRVLQVSAFCWLVPRQSIVMLRKKFGFDLFHPDFSNYGSDDVTAACLRSIKSKPFKIVPRSWVHHEKAQTANELGVKPGTPELLRRIANFKRARRLA